MHTALTADISLVKAAFNSAYQLSACDEKQLDRLIKNHFPRTDLLLQKAHTLPVAVELIVRLAVHFKCQYHQVLTHMVYELRQSRTVTKQQPKRHQAEYYPKYLKQVIGLTH